MLAHKLRDKLASLHVSLILGYSLVRMSVGEGDRPRTTGTGTTPEVWELYPCDKNGSSDGRIDLRQRRSKQQRKRLVHYERLAQQLELQQQQQLLLLQKRPKPGGGQTTRYLIGHLRDWSAAVREGLRENRRLLCQWEIKKL